MAQQKFTLKVSRKYDDSALQSIGEDAITRIISRTKSGQDKRGKDFPGYSSSYTGSKDFKIAGKSKDKVNLTLSNEMLNSMEVLETSPGEIVIGFDANDDFNNGKAEGNIKGTYGKKKPIRGKKRDFLGITRDEKKEILSQYPLDDPALLSANVATNLLALRAAEDLAETFLPTGTDILGPQ